MHKKCTAIDEIKNKISGLDTELLALSSMYNLHFIQVKNVYINSILEAYKPTQKEDINLASLLNNNQILLTNTKNKYSKVMNLSIKMYTKIWKIFIKEIEKLSMIYSAIEFHNKFESDEFIKLSRVKMHRVDAYYTAKITTSLITKKIQFQYIFKTREERNFLLENKNIWIHTSAKLRAKIKKNQEKISRLKGKITFKIDPFSSRFVYKFADFYFKKIQEKTHERIKIEIIQISEEKRIILLSSNIFIAVSFIKHMSDHIYKNTLYRIHFDKKRTKQ